MNRKLISSLAAIVAAMTLNLSTQAAIVYVDANPATNTTSPATNWNFRTLGNNNNVFESQSSNGIELTTTITGLTAGNDYNIYGFYWGSSDAGSWLTQFGTSSGNLSTYDESGTLASSLIFVSDPLFTESNRTMYAASLGTITANLDSEIEVFIDDNATTNNFSRAWYDGVGYEAVPEPSAFALLGGMLALTWVMLRRRSA